MDLAMIILLIIDGLLLVGIVVSACIPRKSKKVNEELDKNNKSEDIIPKEEDKETYPIQEITDESDESKDDNNEVVLDNNENLVAVSVSEKNTEENDEVEKALEDIDAKAEEDNEEVQIDDTENDDNTEEIEDDEDISEENEEEIDEDDETEENEEDKDLTIEENSKVESSDNVAIENEEGSSRLAFLDIKHSLVPRKTFSERILSSDERVILYYNEIRNQFKSYKGINARISKRCDSFRKGRELIAKIIFSGKTMKIYLKLNPDNFPQNIYHHKNMGDKKSYREVPMMLKIKSDRAYKNVINLIDEMMIKLEVTPKSKYTDVNYIEYIKNLQNLE